LKIGQEGRFGTKIAIRMGLAAGVPPCSQKSPKVLNYTRMAGMRWPVETALEDGKDGLGMDDYMVRSWIGWHHHMTECILAHHFLVRVQKRLKRGLRH